jgi:N-formylglutamate amidohydrolase
MPWKALRVALSGLVTQRPGRPGCYDVQLPERSGSPMVFSSPHSGRAYETEFLSLSHLDALTLRRSEDSYIDDLFAAVPSHGGALIAAEFPRAWCDVNRERWELDPAMFEDQLPDWVNSTSPRVAAGLGTIARVVATGAAIYRDKLLFADAQRRIAMCWEPYHAALHGLIDQARADFGVCLLVDCHSMPAHACSDRRPVPDIVLGDAFGAACAPLVIRAAEAFLTGCGYIVRRNDPYAGGYVTRHYGRPMTGVHALQVEIARRLYMTESTMEKHAGFTRVAQDMARFAACMASTASRLPSAGKLGNALDT